MDIHVGRNDRFNGGRPVPKEIEGYHGSFGSKDSFKRGFSEGFALGYSEAMVGKEFSAIYLFTADPAHQEIYTAAGFDQGVKEGYFALQGRKEGTICPVAKSTTLGYCSGFETGARLAKRALPTLETQFAYTLPVW